MSDDVTNGSGPLSWRDVYKAVGESEQRVIDTINEAVLPLRGSTADHEVRLRLIETTGSPKVVQIEGIAHLNQDRISTLEKQVLVNEAIARGRSSFLGSTKQVIVFAVTLAVGFSAALGIITAIVKFMGA